MGHPDLFLIIKSQIHGKGRPPANGELSFAGGNKDTLWLEYDFLRRQLDPIQGRWISPDPAGISAADPNNPQSWNRYAYVLNNPLSSIDRDGLWCIWDDGTGHDDDPGNGGAPEPDCIAQGGHWDKYDTITYVLAEDNVITQIDYVGESGPCLTGDCGAGMTLEGFDRTLQDYSVQGVNPIELGMGDYRNRMKNMFNNITGVYFPQNRSTVSWGQWRRAAYDCLISPDPLPANARVSPKPPGDSSDILEKNSLDKSNTVYLANKRGRSVPVTGASSPGLEQAGNAALLVNGWAECVNEELGR